MGIMETVKRGFSLMISSLSVVGIFFVYGAVTNIINMKLTAQAQGAVVNPQNPLMAGTIIFSFVSVFAGLYLQAASMGYFKDKLRVGKADLSTFFASGVRYYLPLLLFALIIMAVVAVASIGSVVFFRMLPRPAAILGTVVLITVALGFVVAWFLAPYAIVVSGKRLFPALQESVGLVKKHLLKIVLIGLILVVIGFSIGFIFGLITGVAGAIANQKGGGTVPQSVITIMSSIVNAFLGVFMTATYMYFYLKVTNQEHATAA